MFHKSCTESSRLETESEQAISWARGFSAVGAGRSLDSNSTVHLSVLATMQTASVIASSRTECFNAKEEEKFNQ